MTLTRSEPCESRRRAGWLLCCLEVLTAFRTDLEPSRHTLGFLILGTKIIVSGALNARSGAVKNLSQEHVLSAEMHEK